MRKVGTTALAVLVRSQLFLFYFLGGGGVDVLKINSPLMTGLAGKAVGRVLQKKLGLPINVDPKDISVVVEGPTTKVHLTVDATIPTDELEEFIKKNLL